MKFLIAGCGSIGRRHAINLKTLGIKEFVLCDINKERLKRLRHELEGCTVTLTDRLDRGLEEVPDAAVIATPSSMHLEMALLCADHNVNLFIEKPLSHTLDGVEELLRTVNRRRLVAMMGMCYRFHPVFLKIKSLLDKEAIGRVYHVNYYGGHYLPDWHPQEDYRKEYAARRELGGGVVLTSIHGLDNIRWLFGEVTELKAFMDKVSELELDVEDIAIGVMRTDRGIYVNWHTDFIERTPIHRIFISADRGIIRADIIKGVVRIYTVDDGGWKSLTIPYDVNTMYLKEMEYFIDCLETGEQPAMDVTEGYRTLKLALSVKEDSLQCTV